MMRSALASSMWVETYTEIAKLKIRRKPARSLTVVASAHEYPHQQIVAIRPAQ